MKIIAFINQKGGVGKTTLSINIAAYLAEQGKKVLLIDGDSQANVTTNFCTGVLEKTLYDVVINGENLREIIKKTSIKNLDIAVNNLKYAEASLMLSTAVARELKLKAAIDNANLDYDFCLIDCNPALDLSLLNVLAASHEIVIPIDASAYSLVGLSSLLKFIDTIKILNEDIRVSGFILNNIDRRTTTYKEIAATIEEEYPKMLLKQQVGMNSIFSKMQFARETIINNKNNNAYNEIANITKELEERWEK